ERVALCHLGNFGQSMFPEHPGIFEEPIRFNALDGCESSSASRRVFFMRIVAQCPFGHDVQLLAGNQRCQWKNPAAQPFSDDQYVGNDIIMLAGKHLPGSSQAMRNFIEDQQSTVPVARGSLSSNSQAEEYKECCARF